MSYVINNLPGATFDEHMRNIDSYTHFQMAELHRNAPIGHIYFDTKNHLELVKYFNARFKRLGGMTAEFSKKLGNDNRP